MLILIHWPTLALPLRSYTNIPLSSPLASRMYLCKDSSRQGMSVIFANLLIQFMKQVFLGTSYMSNTSSDDWMGYRAKQVQESLSYETQMEFNLIRKKVSPSAPNPLIHHLTLRHMNSYYCFWWSFFLGHLPETEKFPLRSFESYWSLKGPPVRRFPSGFSGSQVSISQFSSILKASTGIRMEMEFGGIQSTISESV